MASYEPVYLTTYHSGALHQKAAIATERLRACRLCPRECGVNRLAGETGVCRTGRNAWVSSYQAHFGEEAVLVGRNGSGTIFFTHCNLLCTFCQNYDISHQGIGEEVADEKLANMMLLLQQQGCHNINFVTPSHVVPQILAALESAIEGGLTLPLIFNTGGYDSVETLRLLDGVFDIYMPDFKFWDPDVADRICNAPDYPEMVRQAVREMHRQVGDLVIDSDGLAQRGLLVRHLVMPHRLAGTRSVMRFLARKISTQTYVNIMTQYRPCGQAHEIAELATRPGPDEFNAAFTAAREAGLPRFDPPRRLLRFV
jgi:putative pyruvate formate lyase activating enzyme